VGPLSGRLDNNGERVRLQRPDEPPLEEPDFIPRLTEDETRFSDEDPWPSSPDGGGDSLARVLPPGFGMEAAQWIGATPTPGSSQDHPVVASVVINGGQTDPPDLGGNAQPSSWQLQRSDIRTLVIAFSEPVIVTVDDLTLTNLGLDAPNDEDTPVAVDPAWLTVEGTTATLTFPARQLPPGAYRLQIESSVVDLDGKPLDGNQDGTGGDAFVFQANAENRFYVLAGDFNGDGAETIFDFPTFAYWFAANTAPDYLDLNDDGGVTIFDFSIFAENFNLMVVLPTGLSSPASASLILPASLDESRPTAGDNLAAQRLQEQSVPRDPLSPGRIHVRPHVHSPDRFPLSPDREPETDLETVLDDLAAELARFWQA
jgi:hypothetical protein